MSEKSRRRSEKAPDEFVRDAQGDGVADADPTPAAEPTEEQVGVTTSEEDLAPHAVRGEEDVQRQLDEQRDKYLRLAAEYENFRKRAARERQEAGWRAQADVVKGLIDALDDLARFAHLDPATVDASTVVQGAEMVERKALKSLAGHGLEVVNPLDQPFDPAVHEAVATEPALSREDDHLVARVFQPGYVFKGQLVRPARVVVKQWNG